jgi:hypothetical protein
METWAPAITAPLGSDTVPLTVATAVICALAIDGRLTKKKINSKKEKSADAGRSIRVLAALLRKNLLFIIDVPSKWQISAPKADTP